MEFRSWFVVVVVFYVPTELQYSTVLSYMCSEQEHKAEQPRAQEGTRTTGTVRELIHGHLKAAH